MRVCAGRVAECSKPYVRMYRCLVWPTKITCICLQLLRTNDNHPAHLPGCGMQFGSLTMACKLWCPLLPGYGCLLLMVYDRLSFPCCVRKAQVRLFFDPDRSSYCIANALRCSIDEFNKITESIRCGGSSEIRRKARFSLSSEHSMLLWVLLFSS